MCNSSSKSAVNSCECGTVKINPATGCQCGTVEVTLQLAVSVAQLN